MPPTGTPRDKRVILRTVTGRWAGLREIQGTTEQLFEDLGTRELPPFVDEVDFGDHSGPARLMLQQNRYVLYAEVVPPPVEEDGA